MTTTQLTPKAQAARRDYYRAWRKQHPEKQAEYNRTYWERKAASAVAEQNTAKGANE